MKRRVHWLAAVAITLIVASVIALQGWYWGGFTQRELPSLFLFALAFFALHVALYLSPPFSPSLQRIIRGSCKIWPYVPRRVLTIALLTVTTLGSIWCVRSY